MGVKQDRYNRRKREQQQQQARRDWAVRETSRVAAIHAAEAARIAAIQAAGSARDATAAYAAAKKISDAANVALANAQAAAAKALADSNKQFPEFPTNPSTPSKAQKEARDAQTAADIENGKTDVLKLAADKASAGASAAANASNVANAALAEDEDEDAANAGGSSKRSCGKTQFPEIQSVDPPVLIISTFIFIVLVVLCYFPFKLLFDSTIIQLFADIVISPNIQLTIYQRMLGSKFVLFLLVFLTLTLTILFGVYRMLLRGSPEHYSSVYACISVCFFTTVFVTFLLLEFFPYLVNIFENTIGYLWICIRPKIGKGAFNMDDFNGLFGQNIINTIEDKYEVSYKFLITLMSLYNMDNVINDFNKAPLEEAIPETVVESLEPNKNNGLIHGGGSGKNNKFFIKNSITAEIKKQIANLCFIKYSTGHFAWIYFASLICTFTSIKAFSKYLI